MIDSEFLNLEIYAIYSAVNRLCGKEKQEEVVKLSGEILFSELKDRLKISEPDPVSLTKTLMNYLVKVGYQQKAEVEKKGENELLVYMHGGACRDAVVKLKNEGAYPPHFLTTLIFAGIKKMFNMKVELAHLEIGKKPQDVTVEKWVLSKLKEK